MSMTPRDWSRSAAFEALESERRLFYVALTRARKGVLIGSSAQPSRFLEEIQLPCHRKRDEALQWLACGDPKEKTELLQSLECNARAIHCVHSQPG